MYNEEGEQVWEQQLDTNGKPIYTKENGITCDIRFQGQEFDKDIELCYNRFRWYDDVDGRYISQDPIGLASGEFGVYNYVDDSNGWTDVLGLSKSSYNGKRGTAKAKHDLERNGYTIVGEEITMKVNGSRVRADIVARDNKGNLHVFEVKHGNGRLTKNQKKAGVYDLNSQSNTTTNLGGGKTTPSKGTKGTFDVATKSDRGKPFGGNGATNDATFHTLVYN
ncbi:RHS repeat-associated core domain-containing protein [Tenacibaculum maritimum]|nr:RHS repeat-associated core domain-containing protein [Tenacibaculum maritimum]MCD9612106.1 RHS repeat-associated core domain-containing protein [Tenacibaculum maritimum]MCD9637331.1 RHS repeat-associated core domain-containing protein [Tenacibaculum maritimum]CAA0186247.1 RHS repeat-associated core domain-containing protein [Tenacibaculum maritimum]